jgi:hypothetical protein
MRGERESGGPLELIPAPQACAYDRALPADNGAWIDPSFTWQAAGAWKVG